MRPYVRPQLTVSVYKTEPAALPKPQQTPSLRTTASSRTHPYTTSRHSRLHNDQARVAPLHPLSPSSPPSSPPCHSISRCATFSYRQLPTLMLELSGRSETTITSLGKSCSAHGVKYWSGYSYRHFLVQGHIGSSGQHHEQGWHGCSGERRRDFHHPTWWPWCVAFFEVKGFMLMFDPTHSDDPLASGFDILLGRIVIQVPQVASGNDYQLVCESISRIILNPFLIRCA